MNWRICLLALGLGHGVWGQAQSIQIQGVVQDAQTGEFLPQAKVWQPTLQQGVLTNQFGWFQLRHTGDSLRLLIEATGYLSGQLVLAPRSDTVLVISLAARSLAAVDIVGSPAGMHNRTLGKISVPVVQLEAVPALFGERDPIKALALTPGVNLGIEGSSTLLVRAGSPDQNLILLDGAKVFNPNHLLGLVSIFNVDAIQQVDLYKGTFPAQYGGRLASVLDIRMKEGNRTQRQGQASIGLLSSSLTWEGPIRSDKTTFFLAGRASYLGLFTLPQYALYRDRADDSFQSYWLYDGNAKINHRFADQSQLFVSFYGGQDVAPIRSGEFRNEEQQELLAWANQTVSLRYHRLVGKQAFWSSQLTASRYLFHQRSRETWRNLQAGSGADSLSWIETVSRPSLGNLSAQSYLDWYPGGGHQLQLGAQWDASRYRPDALTVRSSEQGVLLQAASGFGLQEPQFWVTETWERGAWQVQTGLRLHLAQAVDSLFILTEPRLQVQWKLRPSWRLMGSWGIQHQPAHQLSATRLGLPGDVWIPASAGLPPQRGQQVSVGTWVYGKQDQLGQWELSVEAYYQTARNLVIYQAPFIDAGVVLGPNWPDRLLTRGQGRGYGAEVFFRLDRKRAQYWAAYTLAWSEQRFPDLFQGTWQPSRFDQRHVFNLVGFWKIRRQWQASVNWVWQSGRPVYLPIGQVPGPGSSLPSLAEFAIDRFDLYASEPQRFPDYHRLDLGLVFEATAKRSWKMGVYNLYNRLNPVFLTVNPPRDGQPFRVVGTSFLPFLPYLAYQWTF
ncbi:MAG: TonB-dependent receptor [Bacteroidia bacterium]